ncbi:MAG: hypothetical protein AB7I41_05445 [Candidatus Sericytochromatia bacterium]
MKKILLLTSVFVSICHSAYALPGDKYQDTINWINRHPFLATYYIGPLDSMDVWRIIAFRQLQDNVFLDIELSYPTSNRMGDKKADLVEETLSLVKRKYNRDKEISQYTDSRLWEDVEYLDIWTRENSKAQLLLTKVYSKSLADDFSRSKLIFQGTEYTEETRGEYVREQIQKNSQFKIFAWAENVKIYLGEKYGYEVSSTGLLGNRDYVALKIRSRSEATKDSNILKNNIRMYKDFMSKEESSQKRNSPADIKI